MAVTRGCDLEMQTSNAKDAAGYRCGDWYGYNCYVSPGYSEENLAKVREMCPACCAVSSVSPTDSSMAFDQHRGRMGPMGLTDNMTDALLAPLAKALASQSVHEENRSVSRNESDPGVVII